MADPADPTPASRPIVDETSHTTTLWSLIDLAVREVPRRIPEIDPEAMRLCMSLSCGADLVAYDIQTTVREQQGSVPVINPLLVLSLFGEIEMRDLTRLCNRSRASISLIVDDMVDGGLATRRTSPEDRRVQIVTITDRGRDAFRDIFTRYNQREQYWSAVLTPAERRQFVTLLGKIMNSRINDPDIRLRK